MKAIEVQVVPTPVAVENLAGKTVRSVRVRRLNEMSETFHSNGQRDSGASCETKTRIFFTDDTYFDI